MYKVIVFLFLFVAISLICLILLQPGSEIRYSAGVYSTLFGSSGSGSVITGITAVLATSFVVLSLLLNNLSRKSPTTSKWDQLSENIVKINSNKTDKP